MKNKDFLNLAYPPQWVAKLLHLCISGAIKQNDRGLKTELVYCVIPLIADGEVRKNLNRAKKTSTFFSIFEGMMKDNKEFLLEFSEKYESFYNITNIGLIYLGNLEKIEIGDYISTQLLREFKRTHKTNDLEFEKSSFYLGQLLAKETPESVCLKLGMVPK